MSGSGPGSASAPPPPPPPPPPLPSPSPARVTSKSREDESSSDSPRDQASALAQAFPRAGSAPPPPPPPPPAPARVTSKSREDESASEPPRDQASALAQAFPRAGSAPPPPPPPPPAPARVTSKSREDESASEPPRDQASALAQAFPRAGSAPLPPPPPPAGSSESREDRSDDRGWALVHAFPSAIAEDSVRRGIDFTLETMSPPGVTTISIRRGSIFSDSEVTHGARTLRPLLRLHCIDSTGHLFLISCTVTLGSEGRRTELLVCQKERGRVISITAVPTDLGRQFSTGDAVVGIVAIPGSRSDGETDYVISHLFPPSLESVASADAPSRSAITTLLDSGAMTTFCYYQSTSRSWSTRHAAITGCSELSGFRQVHSVLSLNEKLLGFVDLSCGLVLSGPLGEQASFLRFPQPEASTSSDTDYAICTRRYFGRSDEQLVFVAIHNSPPSISTWTMEIEGEDWTPQHHNVPLLDIKADPSLISPSLLRWGGAAPSVIFVHPHDSNSVFLSSRGFVYCVDLKKRNLIGLPQLITNGRSSSLSSLDFCLWVMPEVTDEVCWEMVRSDEIVNCNTDSKDRCSFVYKLKLGDTPWRSQLLYNKYNDYGMNVLENNRSRVESLQQGAEWVRQFAPLADHILPVPVCSLAVKASSRISQASKAGAVIGRAVQLLRSVIHPPDHFVVIGVANKAQARYAVARWNESSRSQWYCVEVVDHDQVHAVKEVLHELAAGRLLWLFHPELCHQSQKLQL